MVRKQVRPVRLEVDSPIGMRVVLFVEADGQRSEIRSEGPITYESEAGRVLFWVLPEETYRDGVEASDSITVRGEIGDRSVGRLVVAMDGTWGAEGWLDGGSLLERYLKRGRVAPLDATGVAMLRAEWGEGQ